MVFTAIPGASAAAGPDAAASTDSVQDVSDEKLKALVETLEDENSREEFVGKLRALLIARESLANAGSDRPRSLGATLLAAVSQQVQRTSATVIEAAKFVAKAPEALIWIQGQMRDADARSLWTEIAIKLSVVLGLGFVGEWLARGLLTRPLRTLQGRPAERWPLHIAYLAAMAVLFLAPIAVFAALTYGVLPLMEPSEMTRLVALAVIHAHVIGGGVVAFVRALLLPNTPSLRPVRLTDETANYIYIWARRLTSVVVYGYFGLQAALLLGLPDGAYTVLLKLLGFLVSLLLVMVILQNRSAVARWLRGEASTDRGKATVIRKLRHRTAHVWHVLALLYVLVVYVVWALGIEGGLYFVLRGTVLSAVVLVAAGLISMGTSRLIRRAFAINPELKNRYPALEVRANRYLPVLHRLANIAIYAIAALLVLEAWGVDAFVVFGSDLGRAFLASAFKVALIVAVAIAAWEVISLLIERYLMATDGTGTVVERSARARTLLPLARKAVMVVLVAMVSFLLLSELGINIAPLLAGAGVIGLAIGFGAQSLVKDVISGFFILLENTFAIGDMVDLGGNAGIVEAISIRTVRLRDLNGTVHTLPYGEVARIQNLSKDFSYAVMDIGIAYREDVDHVIEVVKQIGTEMLADAECRPLILEPLEVLGVNGFADSAVIIRARIKTKPLKQFMIRRQFNGRMKNRFDELGIEIPFPHQTIYFGVDREGTAPPARVLMQRDGEESPRREAGRPDTVDGDAPV